MVIINWADSRKLNSNPAKEKAEKQFDMHVEPTKYLKLMHQVLLEMDTELKTGELFESPFKKQFPSPTLCSQETSFLYLIRRLKGNSLERAKQSF